MGGEIFPTCPDRPWDPLSLLYNGYRVFPGVKYGRGVMQTTHPFLMPRSWKSRAIPLPTLWTTTGPVTGTLYLDLYLYLSVLFHQSSIIILTYVFLLPGQKSGTWEPSKIQYCFGNRMSAGWKSTLAFFVF